MQNKKNQIKCSLLVAQLSIKMEIPEEQSKETEFLRIVLVNLKESKMQERRKGKNCGEEKKKFCERNSCKIQLLPGDHRGAKACKTTKIWYTERLLTHIPLVFQNF